MLRAVDPSIDITGLDLQFDLESSVHSVDLQINIMDLPPVNANSLSPPDNRMFPSSDFITTVLVGSNVYVSSKSKSPNEPPLIFFKLTGPSPTKVKLWYDFDTVISSSATVAVA